VLEIEQIGFRTKPEEKTAALIALLKKRPLESVLVFCNQKLRVQEVANSLKQDAISVVALHGDLEQFDRERAMAKFRNRSSRILVATDVAARGIDVVGLDAVINYDLPADPEQYVHRIGRTGRAGAKGLAISFVTSFELAKLERIRDLTGSDLKMIDKLPANSPGAAAVAAVVPMDTLSISGGRKDKLRPGDILGALTGDAGVPGDQVGKIEILDRISYVAVARTSALSALARLQQGKIKGRRFNVQRVH
jgi:ATP-dependent RNA helicase DbpA